MAEGPGILFGSESKPPGFACPARIHLDISGHKVMVHLKKECAMEIKKILEDGKPVSRRTFLKTTTIAAPALLALGGIQNLFAGKWEQSEEKFWQGTMFRQTNVDLARSGRGFIGARIDKKWHEYKIQTLSPEFVKWNLESRLEDLGGIEQGTMPSLAGPHSAAVASYGTGRRDSRVVINNAVKGIGCAPRTEKLKERIALLKETFEEPMSKKLAILRDGYKDPALWDWTKQTSLELYTVPDFETHTFLNIMKNPVVSIVFLDMPSFEIRAVARLVHPADTRCREEERDLVEYVNLVHDYFHSPAPRKSILMVFHVIELFDNSPGRMRGIRVVPPLPAP